MWKKVGREKFTFVEEYVEQRLTEIRQQFDSAESMDTVRRNQGKIDELKWLKDVLKSFRDK
jgi:predicted DNA-binding protein